MCSGDLIRIGLGLFRDRTLESRMARPPAVTVGVA
jgi:hypothetical protein